MADFQRVIRSFLYFFIGVLLSAVSVFSHAETQPASIQISSPTFSIAGVSGSCATTASTGASVGAACSAWAALMKSTCSSNSTVQSAVLSTTATSCQLGAYWSATPSPVCPANYTYSSVTKDCRSNSVACPDSTWTLSGSTCSRPDCLPSQIRDSSGICISSCPVGTTIGTSASKYGGDGSAVGGVICIAGCQVQADTCGYGGGHYGCVGPFTTLGQSCPTTGASNAAEVPATDPRTDCIEKGQSYGTVNGAVVCVAATGSSTTKTETTSSGGTSGTGSTTTKNTSTDCTGGSCSSSTTTTTTSGGSGAGGTGAGSTTTSGTTTEKTDKATFCSENPDLSICKTSTFSGTCAAGAAPACDGDPVQCAQANAAFKLECEISTEPTDDAYKLGKSIAGGGADPKGNPLDPANIPQVDVGSIVSAAAGNRTLSATCIPSPTFSVQGHTYTMDTTLFCQFAQVIGYLMVAASTVIAIRMVA